MTKLIIQIPCYNEADALPVTLSKLPRRMPGCDEVEWLVIDDGSTDGTAEVALAHGVDHVCRLPHNRGLARAFMAGLEACLAAGADIIVNTDADNQYEADDIPKLVAPVLAGQAEIVIGARPIHDIEHFSPAKKLLQKLGSWVVRIASWTKIPDAPSGFRAFSRNAALQMNVFNEYTYTLETIIQAGHKGLSITSVPVRTNPDMRPSRLVKSIPSYIRKSILTIFRIFVTYRPFRFFVLLGMVPFVLGALVATRYLVLMALGIAGQHIQSLILSAILILIGMQFFSLAFIADLMSVNRKLLEDLQLRMRAAALEHTHDDDQMLRHGAHMRRKEKA
jgi:glycosyltransferase involved in cell wall biosynthesis